MEFEWDSKKAKTNLRKHKVSFEEAASVFADVLAAVYEDPDHSAEEIRYLIIGTSNKARLLNVAFTERGERLRITSARKVTRKEKSSMKKKRDDTSEDMRPEYDLKKLKFVGRGIYAERFRSGTNLVLLDKDVREAFPDDKSVNEA